MRQHRWFTAGLVIVSSLSPVSLVGQSHRATTPWGDPDLQGLWTNQTPVPLERPAGAKPFFTKEEAAELERNILAGRVWKPSSQVAAEELSLQPDPTLNSGNEAQTGKVGLNLRTSIIVDPPDGRIPYSAEGRRRRAIIPSLTESVRDGKPLPANGPEDRDPGERCFPYGGLFFPVTAYGNNHLFIQAPGYVAILTEMRREHRLIQLDTGKPSKPHVGGNITMWAGDSRGRWEGATLVVETTNFSEPNTRQVFRGATRQLRLVERFTRLDADTMAYRLTVTDPATYTRAWTIEQTFRTAPGPLVEESGCHEGNYGLANVLSAARAEEKRESK